MRFAWRTGSYVEREEIGGARRVILSILLTYVRLWDVATTPRVDQFIANSREVAARIGRYYGRTALVIAPPGPLALISARSTPSRCARARTAGAALITGA